MRLLIMKLLYFIKKTAAYALNLQALDIRDIAVTQANYNLQKPVKEPESKN